MTFGLKLPTGNYTHNNPYGDVDRDSEIGTGSTDLLLLLLVAHHGNPFLLAASAVHVELNREARGARRRRAAALLDTPGVVALIKKESDKGFSLITVEIDPT